MAAGVNPKAVKLGFMATPHLSSPTSYSPSVLAYMLSQGFMASAYEEVNTTGKAENGER